MFKVYFFLFVRREKEIIWIRGNMGMLNLLRVKLLWFKLYFIGGSYNNEYRIDFFL